MDKVVHFEIPFDNKTRAKKFYEKVFGWQMTDVPEMDEYIMAITVPMDKNHQPKEPGAINGGLFKRDKKAKTPVIAIDVTSIEDTVKKIEKEGGKVVIPKQLVGNMGYYARVEDSEGNLIGIWQAIHP